MDWWVWFVLGIFLMGTELLAIDAAFYLMFIGVAALITGALGLTGIELELWLQCIIFAALALASMVLFRKRLYQKLKGDAPGYDATPLGETLRLDADLLPGDSCRISFRGSNWTVQNGGESTIEKDQAVEITDVRGLTLVVGKDSQVVGE